MYIIQLWSGGRDPQFGCWEDKIDNFDTFDNAKAWALANMADIFEENYSEGIGERSEAYGGTIWRIVYDDREYYEVRECAYAIDCNSRANDRMREG